MSNEERAPQGNECEDEFYVGYLPETPDGIAGHVRRWTVVIGLVFVGVGLALAVGQREFDVAFFDFGSPRTFEGTVLLEPQPLLRVERPGRIDGAVGAPSTSDWLLVGFGKAGALGEVGELDGRRVRLEGTPIYRDDYTQLEIVSGSVEPLDEGASASGTGIDFVSLGEQTLEGEIVDSKCYLGVMKPGAFKPHKACATLCIRGGIPPILVLRRGGEPVGHLLLVGPEGKPLGDEILPFVAEPVRIRGEVVRSGETFVLHAEPSTLERIP